MDRRRKGAMYKMTDKEQYVNELDDALGAIVYTILSLFALIIVLIGALLW